GCSGRNRRIIKRDILKNQSTAPRRRYSGAKDRSRSRTTRRWICKNRRQKPLWLLPSVLYLIICRGIGTEFVVVLDTGHGTFVHHVRIPLLIRLAEVERVRIARPAPRLIHGLINPTLLFLPVVFLG